MIRPIFALMALVTTAGMNFDAQAPLEKCRSIADSPERLRCYDAIKSEPAETSVQPAQPAVPGEDPLITKAKATVKSELRDPDSARFQDVKLRAVGGKQAVCGLVNATNARGRMTGLQPFAYDGEHAYLIIYNPGPANSSSLSADVLGESMGSRLKNYNRLCR
jgi:hypothetical protein